MASRNADNVLDRFHPPSYMHTCRPLTIHDEEFHRIEYSLGAALGTKNHRIVSIHALHSPQQDAVFESQFVGSSVLESWVDARDLPEDNTVPNMLSHGSRFRIQSAHKGAIFRVGQFDFEPSGIPPGMQQYEFVHFRVATGRSFVVDPQQVGAHGIPAGYDSIVIHKPRVDDVARDGYSREYIMSDENRVYPDFVVNFVIDIAKLPIQPSPEAQMPIGNVMCKSFPTMPVQFWDPVAHVPVCIKCKMQGSHSHGEAANRQLVPIKEAFNASMQDLAKEHEIIGDRARTIEQQLASIGRRMEAVNENHMRCHDQIYEIVQRVVQVLHEETQSKLSALLSDESELKRQLEYYQFMDNYLGAQQQASDPVEFLQAYRSHSSLLAQSPSEIVDAGANVKADITVVGRMDLVVDDSNPNATNSQQQQQQSMAGGVPGLPPQPAVTTVGGGLNQTPARGGSVQSSVGGRGAPMSSGYPPVQTGGVAGKMMQNNAQPRFNNSAAPVAPARDPYQ